MFENLFPILGQLITTALVGGLLGTGIALLGGHVIAAAMTPRRAAATPLASRPPVAALPARSARRAVPCQRSLAA